jgi:hypothetical protein
MSTPARPDQAANTTVYGDDESIPVLTERLTLPKLDLDFALPTLEPAPPEPAPALGATTLPPRPAAAAPTGPSAEELRDVVLGLVLERLPDAIDAQIRERLRPAVDTAVDAAVADLAVAVNRTLRETLIEIIEQAVRDAIGRRDDPNRPPSS